LKHRGIGHTYDSARAIRMFCSVLDISVPNKLVRLAPKVDDPPVAATTTIEPVRFGIGLILLLALTLTALTLGRIPQRRDVFVSALRATVQLSIVALALRGVFAAPFAAVAVVAMMFSVATYTSTRRLAGMPGAGRAVLIGCGAGAGVAIGIVCGLPALDRNVRTLVAVCGIVFGGTMTAATLTGRRLQDGLRSHRDEIEAWLSVGATARQACGDVARRAAAEALVPILDQTRTVGLVTLPGAFVGALLGGASATQAAEFQIVVLVALLCAEAITAVAVSWLLGAPVALPVEFDESQRKRN
jgi:putative ABC transport system permease protein